MKILIIGKNGFLGKSIYSGLKSNYNIDTISHTEIDLLDIRKLELFLKDKNYNIIINCCLSGEGRLLQLDSCDNFYENLLIQENLLYLSNYYSRLILFSSGAQELRKNDIIDLKEGQFGPPPNNCYSLAKYINSKRIIGNEKVINLRIFNCFGVEEKNNRFIKSNILKYINKEEIEIWGDTFFDFFYIKDLFTILDYCIKNTSGYVELNCVYKEKYKFSQICDIINNLDKYKINVIIKDGINKHYTGSSERIEKLKLPWIGLENGIKDMYNHILNEQNN